MHDHAIADVRVDERPGNAAIVGPRMHDVAGCHFQVGDARRHLDLDYLRIRIQVARLGELQSRVPTSRGQRRGRYSGVPGKSRERR
jgi:hypothetical protein